MKSPPKKGGVLSGTPLPNPFNSPQNNNSSNAITQIDPVPLVCSAKRERDHGNAPIQNTPPHSDEAEQGVLGSMLQSSEAIREAMMKIGAEHFYVPAHQTIFSVLVELWNAGQAIDLITFTQVLRDKNLLETVGGAAAVTHLSTFVPTAANVAYYLAIVRDKFSLRSIIAAGTESVRRAYEPQAEPAELIDEIESSAASIRALHGRNGQFPAIEDAAGLIAKPIILPDDVIEGVLHRGGKMVASGASKTNKTWLLIDLGISVATGSPWLNFPTQKGKILYVNFELPPAFFTKRIRDICDENQIRLEPGMLNVLNLRGHVADWAKLQLRIAPGDFALIILDPCYKLLFGRDENKAGDIASLMDEFDSLTVRTGAAVAFGAHYSKGNQSQKEAIDRISGSGVFSRDPDAVLNFTRHEADDCFSVEATLRNHAPINSFVVRWDYPVFTVDQTLDPSNLKTPGRPEQYHAADILALITEPMSASAIVKAAYDELNIPRRRTFELLAELKASDRLRQPQKRGPYEPV